VTATVLAASYSFWDFFWDVLLLFAWIIWFWLLITVFIDIFRRHDTSGFSKVLWVIFVIILPYIGVLIYLLVEHQGMAERNMKQAQQQQQQFDQYVQSVAKTDPAEQISKAQQLLSQGAITQEEFDQIKAKALA
jgi:predicted PurR-regulated permease PerM